MSERLKVLAIGPHPDDETIFMGGALAEYAKQGALVDLLVLTSGEKGKVTVSHRERGVVGFREVENGERLEFLKQRQRECLEASRVLGINQVEFLGISDQGINASHLPLVREKIEQINPHVILTFNEAGTTGHPDHSWTGLLSFYAVKAMFRNAYLTNSLPEINLNSLMMYTLPQAKKLLEKHGELITNEVERVAINTSRSAEIQVRASNLYKTQGYLIEFFKRIGVIGSLVEYYIDRISRNGDVINFDSMPYDQEKYYGSSVGFYDEIVSRCEAIEKFEEKKTILFPSA